MAEVTMVGALNAALRDALREDDRVLVFGEDVGRSGGVFRVTDGLQAEFGDRRCSTPRSARRASPGPRWGSPSAGGEASSRCSSTRSPIRRSSRSWTTSRRCASAPGAASTCRSRSGCRRSGGSRGRSTTERAPRRSTCTRPDSRWSAPSNPGDAYRLLRLAIADPDPVIVLEPKARYWAKARCRSRDRRLRDRRGRARSRRRRGDRVHLRRHGGPMPRRRVGARRRGARGSRRRPAIALPARYAADRPVRARDRSRGRRARSAQDARPGRRSDRAHRRGGVRIPGSPPCDA